MVVYLPRTLRDGRVGSLHESGLDFILKGNCNLIRFYIEDYGQCEDQYGEREDNKIFLFIWRFIC